VADIIAVLRTAPNPTHGKEWKIQETHMKRHEALFSVLLIAIMVMLGCSGGNGDPLSPDSESGLTGDREAAASTNMLWGYYNVTVDLENETVEAVPNRNVMYELNINTFLNGNPAALGFTINGVASSPDYLELDMDVSITHPIPGKPQFDGYDVRGTLITDAGATMAFNPDLHYPTVDASQMILNADGYTRWFNKPEFTVPGVGGYTPGIYGTKHLTGDSTINPYKYFADGIAATDDPWGFLNASTVDSGVFSSGSVNTRNYIIGFPLPTPGVQFDYSIVASWAGATVHPANTPEAVACNTVVTDSIYYVDSSDWGGDLIADVSLFYWDQAPTQIIIESSVLSTPYFLNPIEMTPVDSDTNWATWHFEAPADNVTGYEGNEFWVIAEYGANDYSGPFGIPNDASSDTLAAFYRNALYVSDEPPGNLPPEITSGVTGASEFYPEAVEIYSVVAVDPEMDTLTYAWETHCLTTTGYEFSGPGDGAGNFTVDWAADVGATVGMEFVVNCDVSDGINPAVPAITLPVTCVEYINLPPIIVEGVNGDLEFAPDSIKTYFVGVEEPEMDEVGYTWETHCVTTAGFEFAGPGDGLGSFIIDWPADVGATPGMEFVINCEVTDFINLPQNADPLTVTCVESAITTLYLYDGMVDDGGINPGTWDSPGWEYCPDINAWDEYYCGNYPDALFTLCRTPYIDFPDPGTFTTIHLEIWHWANTPADGYAYGDVGYCYDDAGVDMQAPNWIEESLVYIDGMDFNDPDYEDFIDTFGTESDPAWSHFDCSAYAGNTYGIALAFQEWGASSGDAYEGWHIRKLHIWVEP